MAHVRLATSKLHVGQFDAMRRHARIGLELCRKLGEQRGAGLALWLLGSWAMVEGEYHQAESWYQESVACFSEVEGAAESGWVFATLANCRSAAGPLRLG